MPGSVVVQQMGIFNLDHRSTRAGGAYDRILIALEYGNRVFCLLNRQIPIAAVKHWLAAAGLILRKIDGMSQTPEHVHHGLAGSRAKTIAEAGDHERNIHRKRLNDGG